MKRVVIGFIAGTVLLVAAGCGVNQPTIFGNDVEVRTIDGIQCVLYANSDSAGGISCNWEAYNSKTTP